MKIVSVVGARPQFIKLGAISRSIKNYDHIEEIILHTGQHYDDNMSDIFFNELQIPKPNYNLNIGSGSHGYQTGEMIKGIEEVLIKEKPDWVVTYGDTNSTLAGALSAVKLHIPVAHIEAGLRSNNRKMPEEINRIATDSISDLLFAPTQNAMNNLVIEGKKDVAVFSGDVMYDSVLFYKEKVEKSPSEFSLPTSKPFYLATIHRAENTDDNSNLTSIFNAFALLSNTIILPIHPRTRKKIEKLHIPDNVIIIDPVGYLHMIFLLLNSEKVFTDSGGLQKEAFFLNKQCITLRNETEWVETLKENWNILVGTDGDKIIKASRLNKPNAKNITEFGDGNSAKIIIDELLKSSK